jgi:hypothetical protein
MTNTPIENHSDDVYELGTWIGRRQAFAAVAGSCSAADAESLRQVRNRKQYRALGMNWDAFCQKRVGINRRTAEQIIHRLEEFGPQYFALAQVTGVTPEQYRRLAASVSEKGLLHAGETIAISAENGPRLNAAVEELKRAPKPAAGESNGPNQAAMGQATLDQAAMDQAIDKAGTLLRSAVNALERVHKMPLKPKQRDRLADILVEQLQRLSMANVTAFRVLS